MTTLRALLERWTGGTRRRPPWPKQLRTAADFQAATDHSFDRDYKLAHSDAKFQWQRVRMAQRRDRRSGRTIMPPSEETALLRQITGRKPSDRERAAALLHGRDLSPEATRVLVWQLRHRNPAYRQAAMDALWGSTITDFPAGLVLAGQLDHRKPELREVAREVLQKTNINIKHTPAVNEYVDSARRRSLGNSDN